jgi:hypothetical protein
MQLGPVRFYQRPEGSLIALPSQREQRVPVAALRCILTHRQHYIDPD